MKVVTYSTAAEFAHVAGPLLAADPVRNATPINVLARLLANASFSDDDPVYLTVHDADGADLIGAALCTPPFPIIVTALPAQAAPVVVDHLLDVVGFRPVGVHGMRPEAEAFLAAWSARTGDRIGHQFDQRLYRLGELVPPTSVEGGSTLATDADVDLLVDWVGAFAAEVHLEGPQPTAQQRRRRIQEQRGAYVIWRLAGAPVSLAVISAPEVGVAKIAPVYTPPELRGHGYASAATAKACQWGLDQGADHVVLYTDLANPISNSIYQRIGFVPVADALDLRFASSD